MDFMLGQPGFQTWSGYAGCHVAFVGIILMRLNNWNWK